MRLRNSPQRSNVRSPGLVLCIPTYFFSRSSSISASSRCRAISSGSVSLAFTRNSAPSRCSRGQPRAGRQSASWQAAVCGWQLSGADERRTLAAGNDVLGLLDRRVVAQGLEEVAVDRQRRVDAAAHRPRAAQRPQQQRRPRVSQSLVGEVDLGLGWLLLVRTGHLIRANGQCAMNFACAHRRRWTTRC